MVLSDGSLGGFTYIYETPIYKLSLKTRRKDEKLFDYYSYLSSQQRIKTDQDTYVTFTTPCLPFTPVMLRRSN